VQNPCDTLKTEVLEAVHPSTTTYHKSIIRAAELLRYGELVAFPTDTVYGVAAIADRPSAVARLYFVKGRPPEKPIPILVADVDDLGSVVTEISGLARRLMTSFWPGGLTLVLPKRNTVPLEVSAARGVAVRLPDLKLAREIISTVGIPLAVTSANRSGRPNAHTAEDVMAQLGGRIAAIVDGGTCPGGVPSTILDCTTEPPRILRDGAIPVEALRQFTEIA
jgi:L-threonylcarbamoyladenylate synthase